MAESWHLRRCALILPSILFIMSIAIAAMYAFVDEIIKAIFYFIFTIFWFRSLYLRIKKPYVVVSNEDIVITKNPFCPKVFKWQYIQEIKRITKRRISLLVNEVDFGGIYLLTTINIWLSNINRDERESLIQTIKDRFESAKNTQEISSIEPTRQLN